MTDVEKLKKVQSRRFMARFDLPIQDISQYDKDGLHQLFMAACCPTDKQGNPRWKVWGQVEKGEQNNRWHIQLYYESLGDAPIRASTIVNAIRKQTDTDDKRVSVYIQRAVKKPARCVGYVTKEKTRVFGPWSNVPEDEWPQDDDEDKDCTQRDDLYEAVMVDGLSVRDILMNSDLAVAASSCMNWVEKLERERQKTMWGTDDSRRTMEVLYVYGDTNTGKTTVAGQYLTQQVGSYFSVTDYRRDPWDGYSGEPGVLFDDLRLPTQNIGLQETLQMFNGTPYMLGRRYANTWAGFDHVVITSNWSLQQQWQSLKNSAPLSSPLTEFDRRAFFRRFTRVLHVVNDGTIIDETAMYRENIDQNGRAGLDALNTVLAKPVPDKPVVSLTGSGTELAGLNVVREGRAETIQDAIDFFNL